MFGFTASPCKGCSKGEIKSLYQSAFCGLSCQLAREYSPVARFLVNRDSTFLALLGTSLQAEEPTLTTRTCCNPLSTAKPLFSQELALEYASAVTVCGLSVKLRDDAMDEKGLRKGFSRLAATGMGVATDRAVGFLNTVDFPTARVQDLMGTQEAIEAGKPSLTEAAHPTAQAYGLIFSHLGSLLGCPSAPLKSVGEALGNLIYWRDAYDDLEKDTRAGKFNLLTYTPEEELRVSAQQEMTALTSTLSELEVKRHATLLTEITSATALKHEDFLAMTSGEEENKRRKKKRRREDCMEHCCDCCSNPGDACSCSCDIFMCGKDFSDNGCESCGCPSCDSCDCGCDCS